MMKMASKELSYRLPESPIELGEISKLRICPIKGAEMIEVNHAFLRNGGFERDREFMIVRRDPDDKEIHDFITQREIPKIVLIQQNLRTNTMELSWKGYNDSPINIDLKINDERNPLYVRVHGDIETGID